jgi:hypothetical protein
MGTRRLALAAVVTAVVATACDDPGPTGVLVVIEADPSVAALASAIELEVYGGKESASAVVGFDRIELGGPGDFPLLVGINPRFDDSDRVWGVVVTAFDATDQRRVVRRAMGGFRRGETRRVVIVLELACLDRICSENIGLTCIDGRCMLTPFEEGERWDGTDPRDAGPADDGGDGGPTDGGDGGTCSGCDDGDPCTDDLCPEGDCLHVPMMCDDGDPCTDDACDPVRGACRPQARPDGSECPDGQCCAGVCTATASDVSHCGGCGVRCDVNEDCAAGRCECLPGFADCDEQAATGCEADTGRDPLHCGGCDRPCTGGTPACLGGSCGACAGAGDCPAALPCEQPPRCVSDRCEYDLRAGFCRIAGVCYTGGASHPTNPCLLCDPTTRTDDWTGDAGSACDDGLYCTVGTTCNAAGACSGGAARSCNDGLSCTSDSCSQAVDSCAATINPGSCAIGGVCYASGARPANPCLVCQPATDPTRFTDDLGASCDDGLFCRVGSTCMAGGTCAGGTMRVCDDGLSCTTDGCDEAGDRCTTMLQPGFCILGGMCRTSGTRNPVNECQVCDPARSTVMWSDASGSCMSGTGTCIMGSCIRMDGGFSDGGFDAGVPDAGSDAGPPPDTGGG